MSDIKYCSPQQLDEMINNTELSISPWFKILYQSGLINKWWNNLDNIVNKNYDIDVQIHDFY